MFNPLKWFDREKNDQAPADSEPANIHPKHKAIETKAHQPTKPVEPKTHKTEPSTDETNEIRKMEFERLGINYDLIRAAEIKGVKGINPQHLARETEAINAKLTTFGFKIKIDCLESFNCQLLYLDYQKFRELHQRTRGVVLPEHSLINIIVLREAEKMVRTKHQLTENPSTGDEAKRFQLEVKNLFELLWNKAMDYQLRQQAQRRLRREKNLPPNEPLLEADVTAMMQKIKTEKPNNSKK
jgi:hypothetical protein